MRKVGQIRRTFLTRDRILLIIEELTKGARQTKWTNATRSRWQPIMDDPLTFADNLYYKLRYKVWQPAPFCIFYRKEGKKVRKIYSSYPEELIVDTLLSDCLEYVFMEKKKIIPSNSYGSIKGKGQHELRRRIFKSVRGRKDVYIASCDTRKYYPTIDHAILKSQLRSHIKDGWMLWLCDITIDRMKDGKGIALGLPSSNILGHVYHCALDWHILTKCKIRHYYRFCDNKYIIHDNANYLHTTVRDLRQGVESLNQEMKNDWRVSNLNKERCEILGSMMNTRNMRLKPYCRRTIERRMAYHQRLQDPLKALATWAGIKGGLKNIRCGNLINYWKREYAEYFRLLKAADDILYQEMRRKAWHIKLKRILETCNDFRSEENKLKYPIDNEQSQHQAA